MLQPTELHFFLRRASSATDDAFRQGVRSLSSASGARAAFRIELAPSATAHAEATAHADAPADAILSLPRPDSTNQVVIEAAVKRAHPVLDLPRCLLLETARYDIVPGSGSVMIFFALHRLTRLSRKEFQEYWLTHHAEHGRRTLIPPNTYSQLHAVDPGELTVALGKSMGIRLAAWDGVAEVYFASVAAFEAQMARAEVAVEALEDEKNFIAHDRSTFGLYEVAG